MGAAVRFRRRRLLLARAHELSAQVDTHEERRVRAFVGESKPIEIRGGCGERG